MTEQEIQDTLDYVTSEMNDIREYIKELIPVVRLAEHKMNLMSNDIAALRKEKEDD